MKGASLWTAATIVSITLVRLYSGLNSLTLTSKLGLDFNISIFQDFKISRLELPHLNIKVRVRFIGPRWVKGYISRFQDFQDFKIYRARVVQGLYSKDELSLAPE